ncbi:MAG: hypothetical protein ACI9VS_004364, partial [Candidatus Binatia bacterium]
MIRSDTAVNAFPKLGRIALLWMAFAAALLLASGV